MKILSSIDDGIQEIGQHAQEDQNASHQNRGYELALIHIRYSVAVDQLFSRIELYSPDA